MATVKGSETLALPRAEVWRRLNDPDVLGASIPGCSGFELIGDGRFQTTLTVVVGPVRGSYAGTVSYLDVEPPDRCTIVVEGKGDKGSIEGRGALELADREGATEVSYQGSFKLTGPVAGVGQRLAPGVSRRLILQTLRNLEAADGAPSPPPNVTPEAAAAKGDAGPSEPVAPPSSPRPVVTNEPFRPAPVWAIVLALVVLALLIVLLVEVVL